MMHFSCRVQQESSDGAERNRFLVNYVDFAFNDFGERQAPVYPGLSTVWGSLARSKVSMDFFCSLRKIYYCVVVHMLIAFLFVLSFIKDITSCNIFAKISLLLKMSMLLLTFFLVLSISSNFLI
jgi:hypothetical protein